MMDDWLKGVLAGAGAVLVASAWTMRQTAKTVRTTSEAEGSIYELFPRENAEVGGVDFQAEMSELDFTNPEFAVTPAEDFSDLPRQNLVAGGYDFNAEDYSGEDKDASSPETYSPAEDTLFDESVVQDEQDGGVDFMNADDVSIDPLDESPTSEDPATAGASDLGGPDDSLGAVPVETQSQEAGMMASHEIEAPLGRGVTFNLGAESSKEKRRAKWARKMRGSMKRNAEGISDTDPMNYDAKSSPVYKLFDESVVQDEQDGGVDFMNAEGEASDDSEPTYSPDNITPDPAEIEPSGPSDTFSFRAEARRWRLPKTSKGTALYAKRDEEGKFTDIQNVTRASRIDRAIDAKTHGVASGDGDEGERAPLRAEGARRWRLPKTSKGTALYAKRDAAGKFTDIQNVTRASRTDRAIKAKTHGVASGHGDEGERAKASPDFLDQIESPFRKISDMVAEIWEAEDSNLMSCTSCDSFWAECGCKGSEYYEASGSNYMKPKDAAAIFAKNKNRLCSVTFTKKDGSTRTLTGRTGVFRARDGSTIVGKGRKPTWDAKARSKAGFITMWDQQAARKAGDNRSGFRVVNLHTISGIRAMGHNYDAAHPKGY
jgi:hypothetical protein